MKYALTHTLYKRVFTDQFATGDSKRPTMHSTWEKDSEIDNLCCLSTHLLKRTSQHQW